MTESKNIMRGLFDEDSDDSSEDGDNSSPPKESTEKAAGESIENATQEVSQPTSTNAQDSDEEDEKRKSTDEPNNTNDDNNDSDVEMNDFDVERGKLKTSPEDESQVSKSLSVLDIKLPFKSDSNEKPVTLHMTRLPNLLGINPYPYESKTYDAYDEEEKYGITMSNMIRCRNVRDSDKESNARVVKWSDGTSSLSIGKEIFDLEESKESEEQQQQGDKRKSLDGKKGNDSGGATLQLKSSHYLYLIHQAYADVNGDEPKKSEEEQESLTVLECIGPLVSKFSAKPSSLQSNAHKTLTLKIRQENNKRARIAETVTFADPEAEKAKRIAMKDTLLKMNGPARMSGRASTGSRGTNRRMRINRNDNYEDEEKYDSFNIKAMKKRAFSDENERYDDTAQSDEEGGWGKKSTWKSQREEVKRARQRQRLESSDEEENEAMFEDEDSDAEGVAPVRMKKKSNPGTVFDDDDDE